MSLLRKSLLANGVFSSLAGVIAVVFATGLADYMSVSPAILYVIGIGTALFGVAIVWEGRRQPVSRGFALFVIAADSLWVAAAIVVLAIPETMVNRWLLAAVSAVVALFAVLQTLGLVRESREHPRRIETEVVIDASPVAVWDRLTRLDAFGEWNPFMVEASGTVEVGQRLDVRLQPPGGSAMQFSPSVTRVTDSELFEWLGHLVVPGLFDGRHRFDLRDSAAERI